MTAPVPKNETRRLARLASYGILDTPGESYYDDVTRLASLLADVPIALLSLVDGERQWIKSRVGLEGSEISREDAFCAHAICAPGEIMVVPDARSDERFADSPLVRAEPNIRFYAGAPLTTPEGDAVGTLCVIDRRPRELAPKQAQGLRTLAGMVVAELELRRNLAGMEETVLEQEQRLTSTDDRRRLVEESRTHLRIAAVTDTLTGLLNRRGLEARLDEEFARATRNLAPLSLLVIDVDRFRPFNDRSGDRADDAVLVQIGRLVGDAVREFDAAARYGGEEFAVLLPNTGGPGAVVLAERVRRSVQHAAWPQRDLSVSIGAATLEPGMSTAAALFAAADEALYAARTAGGNRCVHAGTRHAPPPSVAAG